MKSDLTQSENQEFSLLHEITSILASSFDLDSTLTKIFTTLNKYLSLQKAVLIQINTDKEKFKITTTYGFKDLVKDLNKKICLNISQDIIKSNKPIIYEVNQKNQSLSLIYSKKKTTYFAYPITLGSEKFAILHCEFCLNTINKLHQINKLLATLSLMIGQEIKLKKLMEIETKKLKTETLALKEELHKKYGINNMIGKSQKMKVVFKMVSQVAKTNTNVLILGESGTGKELISKAIHHLSHHKNGPLITINCGAIPENLIESELFGHEKGAFTDAYEQKKGCFEAAQNGTIFLDELAELPLNLQVKLLRVIQEKEFKRIGSTITIKTNARIIAATNQNLEEKILNKTFRKDLYYRLNVFPIQLPPLKERKEDILLLCNHFINKIIASSNSSVPTLSIDCAKKLTEYAWPGNIRELENTIERALILSNNKTIKTKHLPQQIVASTNYESFEETNNESLQDKINNYEKKIIINALTETKGNKKKAAKMLFSTQRIINYKIQKLNINYKNFKQ